MLPCDGDGQSRLESPIFPQDSGSDIRASISKPGLVDEVVVLLPGVKKYWDGLPGIRSGGCVVLHIKRPQRRIPCKHQDWSLQDFSQHVNRTLVSKSARNAEIGKVVVPGLAASGEQDCTSLRRQSCDAVTYLQP
jgi:hypothetical protein